METRSASSLNRRTFLTATLMLTHGAIAATPDSSLIVSVTYDGSGKVSQSNKIYVALWDTPDFVKENSKFKPLETKAIAGKSGPVRFDKIPKNPVYVSLVYDPAGLYDGTTPPKPGVVMGLYSTEQGIPTPIQLKPGQTITIAARLDDSTKIK
jgi:hypothetical protein